MSENNHEICIKMMSGGAFYEYGTNRECKLLSRVQGIDEGKGKQVGKKFANHQSFKCQWCLQSTRVTQTVWLRSHPYRPCRPYHPCHPFLGHLQAFLPRGPRYSP